MKPASLKWVGGTLLTLLLCAGIGYYGFYRHWVVSDLPSLCNVASNGEDWEELERNARTWIEWAPQESIAWFWLGLAQRGQEQFDAAFESFGNVAISEPRGIDAATARLEIQFHVRDQPLDALKIADQILKADPANADARRHRIYFFAMTMQRALLWKEIRQIILSGGDLPVHYLYLLCMDDLWFNDGADVIEKWLLKSPDSTLLQASHLVQTAKRARAQYLSKPDAETEAAFRTAVAKVESQPLKIQEQPQVLELMLLLAVESGNTQHVGELLERVSDESVDDPVFWRYRGWYAWQMGQLEDADHSFRESLRLNPIGPRTQTDYSQFLRSQGKNEGALRFSNLSTQGTALIAAVRRIPHFDSASSKLLSEIATFAGECDDWQVANGVHRHQNPPVQ